MKLNIVPPRNGLAWVRAGLRTFFRQPLAMSGLFFMYMAAVMVVSVLPLVGTVIGGMLQRYAGGKGANQAVAAARGEWPVTFSEALDALPIDPVAAQIDWASAATIPACEQGRFRLGVVTVGW